MTLDYIFAVPRWYSPFALSTATHLHCDLCVFFFYLLLLSDCIFGTANENTAFFRATNKNCLFNTELIKFYDFFFVWNVIFAHSLFFSSSCHLPHLCKL